MPASVKELYIYVKELYISGAYVLVWSIIFKSIIFL